MAEYTFKKLSDVEALTEIPEGANAFIEVNGEVKRVPGDGLGGGGIKTAIIKSSEYDNALSGVSTAGAAAVTYECTNMTFEEAYQTIVSGEPMNVVLMSVGETPVIIPGIAMFVGTAVYMLFSVGPEVLDAFLWTPNGIVAA